MNVKLIIGFGSRMAFVMEMLGRLHRQEDLSDDPVQPGFIEMMKLQEADASFPQINLHSFNLEKLSSAHSSLLSKMWNEGAAFLIAEEFALSENTILALQNIQKNFSENGKPEPLLFVFGDAAIPSDLIWPVTQKWQGRAFEIKELKEKILVTLNSKP